MKNKINIIVWLLALTAGLTGMAVIGFEAGFGGRVYPGIKVAGTDVGGMTGYAAELKVSNKWDGLTGWTLNWGKNSWNLTPSNIGLALDPAGTILKALAVGRGQSGLKNLQAIIGAGMSGVNIEPVYQLDETKLSLALATVSAQINIPAKEPEINIDPVTKSVEVSPGENGQQVSEDLLKQLIVSAIRGVNNKDIEIPVEALTPKLSTDQAIKTKSRANNLVGKTITISAAAADQSWEINDAQIISWLNLQRDGWNRPKIQAFVSELAAAIDKNPQNANFRFIPPGRVQEFMPEKNGLKVKQPETTLQIESGLARLEADEKATTVSVELNQTAPSIKAENVNNFGIKELIGKGESWYSGSIDNRVFNIRKAAELLNGILVAPGEVFSFNHYLGDVSAATGFKQAYIIKEGKTVLGDGGGVCQVSSTLFRAVLAAGLPIDQRVAHAYRVSYYEQNYQPGFDATVFEPQPDFQFKNDTATYILVQTVFDEQKKYLAFELYGTADGRKVDISKARVWDVTAPPPDLYQDDPTLPTGKVVQTEHAAYGAKVAFDWKVTRGEDVLQQRTFYSSYQPWQAVFLKGTKPI